MRRLKADNSCGPVASGFSRTTRATRVVSDARHPKGGDLTAGHAPWSA
jgi:hypothetical protein